MRTIHGTGIEIRKLSTPDGEVWPFLTRHGLPLVLPNLWIDELGLSFRPNTLESYLRDVALVYRWAVEENVNLIEKFNSLKGFNSTELRAIAEAICTTGNKKNARQATCARRLESVRSFIEFAFDYYIEFRNLSLSEQAQAEKNYSRQIQKLAKAVKRHTNISPPPKTSSDLSKKELELIYSIIHPDSPNNPFDEYRIKVRNYCIFQVALSTWIRRSELVLIELSDVDLSSSPTILIKPPSQSNRTKRNDGASLKTIGRCIPINNSLAQLLACYTEEIRPLFVPSKNAASALFLSARDGKRLSTSSINKILDSIEKKLLDLGYEIRLHPHGLRTTGASNSRRTIKGDGVEREEALSYLGGWRQGSAMLRKYTRSAFTETLIKYLGN